MHFDAVIQPRYGETDQMGVVYHANYLNWFEVGRSNFLRQLGYTYRELEAEGVLLPVIEAHLKYIKPALYDVEVLVRTEIEVLKGVRIGFRYRVLRKEDEELLVEGTTLHAFTNKDLKPVRIKSLPETFRETVKKAYGEPT